MLLTVLGIICINILRKLAAFEDLRSILCIYENNNIKTKTFLGVGPGSPCLLHVIWPKRVVVAEVRNKYRSNYSLLMLQKMLKGFVVPQKSSLKADMMNFLTSGSPMLT